MELSDQRRLQQMVIRLKFVYNEGNDAEIVNGNMHRYMTGVTRKRSLGYFKIIGHARNLYRFLVMRISRSVPAFHMFNLRTFLLFVHVENIYVLL